MALSTTTTATLTESQVIATLVKPLEAASVFLSSGVRIIDTAGPLRLPKMGAPTAPAWFAQNALITPEVDPTFSEVALLPSTMKSVKTLTWFSNELARQSVIALDQALKDRLVTDVAATLDAQFFGTTGDGITMPKGLFGHPVIVSNRVPDTTGTPNTANMALVDFSQILVARDLAPSVTILDQTFGEYDQQAIRVVARYDAAALNASAVIKMVGITI